MAARAVLCSRSLRSCHSKVRQGSGVRQGSRQSRAAALRCAKYAALFTSDTARLCLPAHVLVPAPSIVFLVIVSLGLPFRACSIDRIVSALLFSLRQFLVMH